MERDLLIHVGPIVLRHPDSYELVSFMPTSSIRFEKWGASSVETWGLKMIIGKTTMGPRTAEALKEVGGVYLTKIGLSGNALRGQVKKVHDVHFLDELGKTECTWIYEVENFGPFFVAIDADGNNYFEDLAREADAKMPEIEAELGIPDGYTYTEVNG